MDTVEERFWEKVDIRTKDKCWEWQSAKSSRGYGVFKLERKNKYAHRIAWSLVNGEIPNGLWALHKCDNPLCVNPNHLFLGTAKDNAQDRVAKGRNGDQRGELGNNSKLTSDQVLEIRMKYTAMPITQRELATQYGVSQSQISNIVQGREWRHLLSHE